MINGGGDEREGTVETTTTGHGVWDARIYVEVYERLRDESSDTVFIFFVVLRYLQKCSSVYLETFVKIIQMARA